MRLDVIDLHFSYRTREVLRGVSMEAEPGAITAIIGPNAAGKSTLVKCIAGILRARGSVRLDGRDVDFNGRAVRDVMSYLPQEAPDRTLMTVMEAVLLGRLNSLSWAVGRDDLERTYQVIRDLGIADLASKPVNELSGGQQQMVSIAQSLVRNPSILLMDEPMNNLDLQRQMELFEIIRQVTRARNMTTVVVLHDINFSARFADRIVVLKEGQVYCSGKPVDVINEDMVRDIYGVHSVVSLDRDANPQIYPIRSVRSVTIQ